MDFADAKTFFPVFYFTMK